VLIPYGGDHMTQEIMRKQHLTYPEAENLKRIHGFDTSRGKNDITSGLKKHFEKNIKDIKKALSYYEKQTGGKIRKIILAGGGSLLPDIDTFFLKELGIPTVRKNPLFYVRRPYYIDEEHSILYANVIGLALRASRGIYKGINLLKGESDFLNTKHTGWRFWLSDIYKRKKWIFIVLGIMTIVLFLGVFFTTGV
ncbi:MAG: pilus assembly protein PilM, partial [Candidatus Pacebacteria bacterium]|nr:pilus assembly protein PilM [Candidatus Paceibacterota bacterium]